LERAFKNLFLWLYTVYQMQLLFRDVLYISAGNYMWQLYPFVNLFLFLFSLESLGEVGKDAEEQARLTKEGPELVRRAWEGLEYGLMLLGTRYKEKRLDKWEEMLSNLLLSFNNFCIFAGLSETSAKVLDAGISLQVLEVAEARASLLRTTNDMHLQPLLRSMCRARKESSVDELAKWISDISHAGSFRRFLTDL